METQVSKPASDVTIYLRLLNYTKSSWPYFVLSFLGYLLYGAMEPTLAYLLQLIVDTLGNPEAEGARADLTDDRLFLPLFILGIFVIRGTGTFFGSYFMAVIGTKLVFDLRVDMFNKLSELPASYLHSE